MISRGKFWILLETSASIWAEVKENTCRGAGFTDLLFSSRGGRFMFMLKNKHEQQRLLNYQKISEICGLQIGTLLLQTSCLWSQLFWKNFLLTWREKHNMRPVIQSRTSNSWAQYSHLLCQGYDRSIKQKCMKFMYTGTQPKTSK